MAWGAAAADPIERYEGIAYSRADGSVLYRETHWRYRDGDFDRHLVLYGCADGTPFARKLLTVSSRDAAPDFDFYDARLDYREGVNGSGARRVVYVQTRDDAVPKQAELELGVDDVVDAGFDDYLRSHWDAITPRSPLHAAIVVPGRHAAVPVTIAEIDAGDSDVRHLRVQLNAWYRLIAPSMTLGYSRTDRRLYEFVGIGTIRGSDGRNLDVRIVFPPQRRDTSVDPQEALAAARLSLNGHCRP
ncbi:MAG: hypothetical protein J0I77_20895 [Rudaea sp.]|uniref:hypothetical protein n=1 Tax=unclassified Rudaea TaxID=2627037 RepID=UPI0010F571AC|nr:MULTISPECIES: hypothetical protein [unclassified Rudaea]MBN8888184.1 hypothetical protein [Rudaea sp.]MBR0345239.1 hypothetical protein [Rudaea sp.]